MGGADIIPGVSGGTVALVLGIYDRLVTAISRCDLELGRLLIGGRWRAAAGRIDLRFLVALGTGIAGGLLGLATTLHTLLHSASDLREETLAAFFGLVLGSAVLVARTIDRRVPSARRRYAGLLVAGGLLAVWLVGLPYLRRPPQGEWYLFVCGAISICAMILPGISGAFLMVILGKYQEVIGMMKLLLSGDGDLDTLLSLAVFAAGCATGLVLFSKLLRRLFARSQSATLAVLCGLMIGSLRKMWPFQRDLTPELSDERLKVFENYLPGQFDGEVVLTIVIAVIACTLVLVLDRVAGSSN